MSVLNAPQTGSANAPVYKQIIDGIESKLPQEIRGPYQQIVVAGMKFLFDDTTHSMMVKRLDAAQQGGRVPGEIVKGTVDVIKVLHQESQGKMNPAAAFPASATLMYHIFEYAEHKQPGIQFDNDIIAGAAQSLMKQMAEAFHITPEQLQQGIEQNQQQGGDAPPAAAPAPVQEV